MKTQNTQMAHIQLSNEINATIYVVPVSKVTIFLDELVAKGIDISKSSLIKIA